MDRLSDSVGLKHIVLPINWLLTHPPIPHAGQIRNLPCVIINIFHLLVSKIWALRLKFQNVRLASTLAATYLIPFMVLNLDFSFIFSALAHSDLF